MNYEMGHTSIDETPELGDNLVRRAYDPIGTLALQVPTYRAATCDAHASASS